jgi:hypothetical protein
MRLSDLPRDFVHGTPAGFPDLTGPSSPAPG